MDRTELLNELSRRAGIDQPTARRLLDALLDLVREGAVSADILLFPADSHSTPRATTNRLPVAGHHSEPHVVDDLIARARTHRLGVDFLVDGHLPSVAAEFGAHAFTVEAARHRLKSEKKDQ